MPAEDGGWIALHADDAGLQVAADVVGHLPIFVPLLGLHCSLRGQTLAKLDS